jgi:hypothetical protein
VNVDVRIQRLVLDGVELRGRERAALPSAIQEALAELLTPSAGGHSRPPKSSPAVDVYARTPRVEAIAGQIATAVHGGLRGAPQGRRRSGGRR